MLFDGGSGFAHHAHHRSHHARHRDQSHVSVHRHHQLSGEQQQYLPRRPRTGVTVVEITRESFAAPLKHIKCSITTVSGPPLDLVLVEGTYWGWNEVRPLFGCWEVTVYDYTAKHRKIRIAAGAAKLEIDCDHRMASFDDFLTPVTTTYRLGRPGPAEAEPVIATEAFPAEAGPVFARQIETVRAAPEQPAEPSRAPTFLAALAAMPADEHASVVVTTLAPLVSSLPELQLVYAAASAACRRQQLTPDYCAPRVNKAFRAAVPCVSDARALALFGLGVRRAAAASMLTPQQAIVLEALAHERLAELAPAGARSFSDANGRTAARRDEPLSLAEQESAVRSALDALAAIRGAHRDPALRVSSLVTVMHCAAAAIALGSGAGAGDAANGSLQAALARSGCFDLSDLRGVLAAMRATGSEFDPAAFIADKAPAAASATGGWYWLLFSTEPAKAVCSDRFARQRQRLALELLAVAATAVGDCQVQGGDEEHAQSSAPPPDVSAPIWQSSLSALASAPVWQPEVTMPDAAAAAKPRALAEALRAHNLPQQLEDLLVTKYGFGTVEALQVYCLQERTASDAGWSAVFDELGVTSKGHQAGLQLLLFGVPGP